MRILFTSHRLPRLTWCVVLALAAVAGLDWLSPQQLPVGLYKLCLTLCSACLGYWIDRWLFPYARPDGYLAQDWRDQYEADIFDGQPDFEVAPGCERLFIGACLRRAVVVAGTILAVGLGL